MTFTPWRLLFLASGVLILAGGPMHPRGSMAEMLAHPDWVLSHLLILAAFVVLLVGLVLYGRSVMLPARTQRWLRYALIGTGLQALEMVLHTAAYVDHGNLVAGNATPVLTTHVALSVLFYPAFAATMIGFIVAGLRDRVLGSRWIAWLGIFGLVAHGLAAPLTILTPLPWASLLFPLLMLFAFWLVLAGLWPLRAKAGTAAAAVAAN